MKIALVGATGLVGREILKILADFINTDTVKIITVASARSVGQTIGFLNKPFIISPIEKAVTEKPEIAIFSAGGDVSRVYAPKFAASGATVIDNSSAWRMEEDVPLIVPEINAGILTAKDKIIANPNCSTIQMVMALAPLHRRYRIRRIVVSTYQSVTGTGYKAVDQLLEERKEKNETKVYPHAIDLNLFPHAGNFTGNGYTDEEMKLLNETRKILNDFSINITATCVRVPVMGGHSEAINVEFYEDFNIDEVKNILQKTPGIVVVDDPANNLYPMPITAQGKNDTFVGRIRRDESQPKSLNLWVVSDNLRKGAATNAVQIAQYLINKKLV